ncbi:2-oxoglutarate dehydrogenase E1 component [Perkinsela sp. CCAP 1560/4]|nr:2-oxoglutarate dehydrogenase E1 component [Perkinsela sp. CCAP 1560/4]KNH09035.1 2-oxoglutarate dehydrogenase E1 component [Perkinsela sp. CCAP 1560/4]|eukprot:KNH03824.1 2-oxoglutarate dehydrogenase E1 component [Perkinsela sp. CCAP 1560/4]
MIRTSYKILQGVPVRRPLHKWDSFLCAENAAYLDTLGSENVASENTDSPYTWKTIYEKSEESRDSPILSKEIKEASTAKQALKSHPKNTKNDASRLAWFCKSWEEKGHIMAQVDPLKLNNGLMRMPEASRIQPDELEPQFFGFTDADMDKSFEMGFSPQSGGLLAKNIRIPLRKLYEHLKLAYGSTIGYEFVHVNDPNCTRWLRDRIETPENFPDYATFARSEKIAIFKHLAEGEIFEQFLHTKFVGAKRFGLDGGESLIPGMVEMLQRATHQGIDHIVLGMPHRGRLSVLVNICGKPMEALLKEFKGLTINEMHGEGSGDVKYHLGMSNRRVLDNGSAVNLSLLANPSHLEAVNPVVEGKTRAQQYYMGDTEHARVMAVQLHGDAAFAGQGVCYETMRLGELKEFTTGGTIHIVVNNQIGFTTDPKKSRSSPYCTDIGHAFGLPIIHVNADRPEDVAFVFRLAVDFRKRFKKSIIIDLVCYRRFGHNETDEPMFTQPIMYRAIKAQESILSLYSKKLMKDGTMTNAEIEAIKKSVMDRLRNALANVDNYTIRKSEWYDSYWKHFKKAAYVFAKLYPTKISEESFSDLAAVVAKSPTDFSLHKSAEMALQARNASLKKGKNISWDTAEALAMGSLLNENIHVRITGQCISSENRYHRRHLVLVDQATGKNYSPLSAFAGGKFHACESPACSYGVLGFELGFSMENPQSLVIWIAHDSESVTSGQIIFDQFLASGEAKWGRQCGLVMCTPFGMSPSEQSGGRMERFLQAVDEPIHETSTGYDDSAHVRVNMEIVVPTSAANYFHVLRRQIHRNFRKPLIVFAPPNTAASEKSEFVESTFQPVIVKSNGKGKVKKILLCCGQIGNALQLEISKMKKSSTLVVTLEQISPFPDTLLKDIFDEHSHAKVCWVQEEPKNMGAWRFVEPRLDAALRLSTNDNSIEFIGRKPATPSFFSTTQDFIREQRRIIKQAIVE